MKRLLVFFPASGFRYGSSGSMTNVSIYGFDWSASLTGATNGYPLRFDSESAYPSYSTNRAYGFPVRCLQAFMPADRFLMNLPAASGRGIIKNSFSLSRRQAAGNLTLRN